MDLFVVNRHTENPETNEDHNDEQQKLDKVLKKIERNKRTRQKQKEKKELLQKLKQKTFEERQKKRERKRAQLLKRTPVPDKDDEFIDENIAQSAEIKIEGENDDSNKRPITEDDNVNKRPKLDPGNIEGFTILGDDKFDKKSKVKRVLPKWLANPTVISVNLQNLQNKVSSMKKLDKSLRKKLRANRIKYFFPVQATVIPWLLTTNKHADVVFPRDICVSAPTGSGKTLAFVLPIVQILKNRTVKRIRALVILPTQELAKQVYKTFKTYCTDTNLDVCLITGQGPFANEQKMLVTENVAFGYISRVDILVCTAGRLVDHLKSTPGFSLKYLEFLIIDEADRVLDNVQNDWLYHLEKHIQHESDFHAQKVLNLYTLKGHRPPQKLLFSATLSQDPEKLQKLSLFQPALFTSIVENGTEEKEELNNETFIGKYTTPKELTEKYIVCSIDLKPLVLYEFIKKENLTKTLIFTNSAESSHRLTILLRKLFKDERSIEEISSHLESKQRNGLMEKFDGGKIDLLICTDSLARGIDLSEIKCVISYSAPKHLKTYIHRVGRTARAGQLGLAVTMLHETQLNKFLSSLKQAGKSNLEKIEISEDNLEPLGEQYKEALDNLKNTVNKEDKMVLKKLKMVKRKIRKRKRANSISSNKQ